MCSDISREIMLIIGKLQMMLPIFPVLFVLFVIYTGNRCFQTFPDLICSTSERDTP